MKFHHLPIGASFEFQGKRYSKTGPMTASEDGTGKSKMMMRSAAVKTQDDGTEAPLPAATIELNREQASIAVNDYHAECLQIINKSKQIDPAATGKLEEAKKRIFRKLGLS